LICQFVNLYIPQVRKTIASKAKLSQKTDHAIISSE